MIYRMIKFLHSIGLLKQQCLCGKQCRPIRYMWEFSCKFHCVWYCDKCKVIWDMLEA